MKSLKLVIPSRFMKNSFSDIGRKWILPNMIRAGTDCTDCNGQFTPKMKANAVSRLLSSLVGIDQCNRLPALIIFAKMHFLLISENEFFMKYNVTEGQVFMEFMISIILFPLLGHPTILNRLALRPKRETGALLQTAVTPPPLGKFHLLLHQPDVLCCLITVLQADQAR